MTKAQHLAQLNIGRFRYPTDDPRMADFMNNLDLVNGLAERSAGFVWRLKDDSGNATNFRPFPDPNMAVNLSVWDSVEALERFVYQTVHKRFYGRRPEWFDKMDEHARPFDVPQKLMPQTNAVVSTFDQARQVGEDEGALAANRYLAEVGMFGREWIICDLRLSVRQPA